MPVALLDGALPDCHVLVAGSNIGAFFFFLQ